MRKHRSGHTLMSMLRAVVTGLTLAAVAASEPAGAQSCILTRLDSPVVNAFDPAIMMELEDSRWEVSFA